MSTNDGTPPIKPQTLITRIEEEGNTLKLDLPVGWRRSPCGSSLILFVLLFWLFLWTVVGCMTPLVGVIIQADPFSIILQIPIFIGFVCTAPSLVFCLVSIFFSRHRLILDTKGLSFEWRLLLPLLHRHVPLPELRRFQVRRYKTGSEGQEITEIEAVTLGYSLRLSSLVSDSERTWLAHHLDEHRRYLQCQAGVADSGDGDLTNCRDCHIPADCTWSVNEEYPNLTFQQRGRFSMGVFLIILFINGHWNGVLGMVIGELLCSTVPGNPTLSGIAWWGTFLFLLPFEAIGLMLLLGLLLLLLEPFRFTRWIITPDAIKQVTTRLGMPLGRRRLFPYDSLDEATIRDDFGSGEDKGASSRASAADQYRLLLTNRDGNEICSIKNLTLGEARWMKGRLQEHRYVQ